MTKECYNDLLGFLKAEHLRLSNLVFERRVGRDLNGKEEDEMDEKILVIEKSMKELENLNKPKFNLVRQRVSEGRVWVDSYNFDDSIKNPEEAMRNAVQEFLETEDGSEAIGETGGYFNWGDTVHYVFEEILNKHGIYTIPSDINIDVVVDQDEVLYNS